MKTELQKISIAYEYCLPMVAMDDPSCIHWIVGKDVYIPFSSIAVPQNGTVEGLLAFLFENQCLRQADGQPLAVSMLAWLKTVETLRPHLYVAFYKMFDLLNEQSNEHRIAAGYAPISLPPLKGGEV